MERACISDEGSGAAIVVMSLNEYSVFKKPLGHRESENLLYLHHSNLQVQHCVLPTLILFSECTSYYYYISYVLSTNGVPDHFLPLVGGGADTFVLELYKQ